MGKRHRFDEVFKDLFQTGRPSPVERWSGGQAAVESLSVELPVIREWSPDVVLLLPDETLLQVDFQSENNASMNFRMGIYGLILGERYGRDLKQVVLYAGPEKMNMPTRVKMYDINTGYMLVDIREFEASELMETGRPADLVLALLARGGTTLLPEIVARVARLAGNDRSKAAAQLAELAGLRSVSEELRMEFGRMGVYIDVEKNVILKEIRDTAHAKGVAEGKAEGLAEGEARGEARGEAKGKAEGLAEGMVVLLRDLLVQRFGPLPKWAFLRIEEATPKQVQRWAAKVLTATSLEGVLGRRK